MAFATSNVQTAVMGNLRCTYGQWTGAIGDVAGTFGVAGGQVWAALLVAQDASGPYDVSATTKYSTSTSGSVTTVTFYNLDTVTQGRFMIWHS